MTDDLLIRGIPVQKSICEMLREELHTLIDLLKSKQPDDISTILRALHRLKGSTGFIGLTEVETKVKELEHDIRESNDLNMPTLNTLLADLELLSGEISSALS